MLQLLQFYIADSFWLEMHHIWYVLAKPFLFFLMEQVG